MGPFAATAAAGQLLRAKLQAAADGSGDGLSGDAADAAGGGTAPGRDAAAADG